MDPTAKARWNFRTMAPSRRRLLAAGLVVSLCLAGLLLRNAFQRPLVRVGFNEFPPYVDRGPDGAPVGFAVEVLSQAARRAKVDLRWVEIEGSADKAFSEGKADMYPLMTITPERETRFYMSAPWWENQFALISTEGREIRDAAGARGKLIGTRVGVIKALSLGLFPGAKFVDMTTLDQMETALCEKKIDGFLSDVRLLESQLLQRNGKCAGQALHAATVPGSKLSLGTASTRAFASANEKIFREIAELALDGTLSRAAANRGVFMPYDTARLKRVLDAETREKQMAWALVATLLILTLSVVQTTIVRRAKRETESAQSIASEMQNRFDEFMRHTPTITFIKDEKGRVVYSNEEYCCRWAPMPVAEQTGADAKADGGAVEGVVAGGDTPMPSAISRQFACRDSDVMDSGTGVEVTETVRGRDGRNRHFLVAKFPFLGRAGARFLGGVALDVTARILAEKELERQARHDLLTGLPNRRSFMSALGQALQQSQATNDRLAVGFVDLDGFKRVNDLMGHEAGDELLKQVAMRLKALCGEPEMVARLGGDEFTLLVRGATATGVRRMAGAVLQALDETFRIDGKEVFISASIGISLFPEHGSSSRQLLRNADSAMYLAKANGRRRVEFWSPETSAPAVAEGETETSKVGETLRILSRV